jgi:hypothetical protein
VNLLLLEGRLDRHYDSCYNKYSKEIKENNLQPNHECLTVLRVFALGVSSPIKEEYF